MSELTENSHLQSNIKMPVIRGKSDWNDRRPDGSSCKI